jgi:hypothetical protein
MAKSDDHFCWQHLRPMMAANGWYNEIAEIEAEEVAARHHLDNRARLMQEGLANVRYNHDSGAKKVSFRPCHKRKLDTLTVYSCALIW